LVIYTYVIYHLISKLRGNEKNAHMNNFGVFLALLMFVYYSVWLADRVAYTLIKVKYFNSYDHHDTFYSWIFWSADSVYLLFHWLFNWRYVKSTFRLPVLQKAAEFHNEMLDLILRRREEQHIIFSPQKLEEHEREMTKLKLVQRKQERWSTGIEVSFFLTVIASSFPFVYVSQDIISNFLHVPLFLLLNGVMLYSVIKTTLTTKSMPNLFPNENLVLVHVHLFTVVTALWVVEQVYYTRVIKAAGTYFSNSTDENHILWTLSSDDHMYSMLAYTTVNNLLNLFMLYMLHQFSVFQGFVHDPVTGKNVPVLSMFMTAKTMEQGMKDKVLSDRQRAQLKKLMDYEEAQEMFAASESSASIAGSFISNDLGESMRSLRQLDEFAPAVYSDSDSAKNEDELEGEALQRILKGDPIPGSLGDENY